MLFKLPHSLHLKCRAFKSASSASRFLWSRAWIDLGFWPLKHLNSSLQLEVTNTSSCSYKTLCAATLFQQFIFLPAVSVSSIQQRDPKSSAAVPEHCVTRSRNTTRTASHSSAGTGTETDKEKVFWAQSPNTPIKQRQDTHIFLKAFFFPAIVTGLWKVDGWIRPVNKWDSGNASKIAFPTTNRSLFSVSEG